MTVNCVNYKQGSPIDDDKFLIRAFYCTLMLMALCVLGLICC